MKRKLLVSLIAVALMLPGFVAAQTVYMTDGFENGFNPTCDESCKTKVWTQEYYDQAKGAWVTEAPANSQPWKTESGDLVYPTGAVVGAGRAYFRNEPGVDGSVQTAGFKTRLITPVMDLSKGYQPILRFYHAQDKYTGDFDTLRVYYRTGEGLAWNVLAEYTSYIKKWQFEEISLPAVGENYQIAFEANENVGRGIVLDSVLVRTRPQITTPHDVKFLDMHDNGVTIQWQASMDADNFEVVMTRMSDVDLNVNPEYLDSAEYITLDTIVDSEVLTVRIDNLTPGATYYVQIRSLGETENSIWCTAQSVHMKATQEIPYFEDFNIKYKSNKIIDQQLVTWYWGGDIQPVIPLWIGEEYYGNYSPDATPAVAFIGAYTSTSGEFSSSTTFIPGGKVAYIASPELASTEEGFNLSQCHVSFWGTVRHATDDHMKSIIVGVMTDPTDITTFVAVDTCMIWGYESFEFFDIDLASYNGNGRYVAFVSNFDKTNQFYIDKVNIEKRPAVAAVKMQTISCIPDTTHAIITWGAVAGATGYNVKYTKLDGKGASTPLFATDMTGAKAETVTTNAITLSDLTPCSKYAIAIQANDGEWSQPYSFFTSAVVTYPKTYGFEESEGTYYIGTNASRLYPKDWMVYSNDPDKPYCYAYSSYAHTGSNSLYLVLNVGNDAWAVAPWAEDVKALEVKFYDKTSSTSYSGSKVQVGVMTNPNDLNTFVSVSEFTVTDQSQSFYCNFLTYKGAGHYIAFRWAGNTTETNKCTHCLDDVTIRGLGSCLPATGLEVKNVTDSSAVLSWYKADGDKWHILVNSAVISEDDLATAQGNVVDTIVSVDSVQLTDLKFARSYYVYVQTVCDDTQSDEWASTSFKTECPAYISVPYTEDFESCETGTGNRPECWIPAFNGTSTSYPYVTTTYANSGSNSLYMYAYTTYGSFIALPELNKDLNKLKIKYWAKSSTSGYILYIGVMTDPTDPDTFEKIDSAVVGTDFVEFESSFSRYRGTGRYIALSTFNGKSNYVYVDDITVLDVTDAAPSKFTVVDATDKSLAASWDGVTTGQWQLVVSKKYVAITDSFSIDDIPAAERIAEATLDTNYYAIADGLTALTPYYFYVKSTKGKDWGVGELKTACTTWNPREKYTEGFEIGKTVTYTLTSTQTAINYFGNAQVPTCWTVGNQKYGTDLSAASTYTIRGYFPFIFSNGYVSGTTTTNYYDKGTALTTYKYAPAGYDALKMVGGTTQGVVWAAMPELACSDEDLNSLVITAEARFTAATATVPHALIVGIMDDPEDLSTFVVLDSIATGAGTTSSSNIVAIEVAIADCNYTGHGRYIAFRTAYNPNSTSTTSYHACATTVYLDNVCVSLASCAAPSISFAQITDTAARVYSGLKIDNAWKYYLSLQPFNTSDMDAGTMPADSVVIESKVVGDGSVMIPYANLKGLLPQTTYYVAVATMCDSTTSAWKSSSFKTLCADENIDTLFDGFEDYSTASGSPVGCWTVGNLASTSTSYIPYACASTLTGSKKVLKLYSYKSTANGAYAITPGLKMAEGKSLKDYQLHCKVLASSSTSSLSTSTTYEHKLLIGVTTDPSDMSKVVMLDTITYTQASVSTLIYPFDAYQGDGKYVVFETLAEEKNYSYIYLDDVEFELIPKCKVPTKLEADTITDTSITLQWQGNSNKYLVALSSEQYADSVKADSIATSVNVIKKEVTGNTVTFEGLKANSTYYAYVQAICSETDSSEWCYEICAIRTACPEAIYPLSDNFDEYSAYGTKCQPDCYFSKTNYSTAGYYPYLHGSVGYSGTHSMYFYANKSSKYYSLLATPKLNVTDLSNTQIQFMLRQYSTTSSYETAIIVGLVESLDALDTISSVDKIIEQGTFIPLDTCYATSGTTTWEQKSLNLDQPKYASAALKTHKYVVLLCTITNDSKSYGYAYLDDLKVRDIPTCYTPANVNISEIGLKEATLSFSAADSLDTKWQVRVTDVANKTNKTYNVTDTIVPLSLASGTQYTVAVRTDCSGDYSEWSDEVTFNTKYMIDTYTFTFDKDEQGTTSIRSPKSTSDSYFIHPALTSEVGGNATSYLYYPYQYANSTSYSYSLDPSGNTTSAAMKFYTYSTYDSATVILPCISNPQGKQLSFYMRAGYAYSNDYSTIAYRNVVSYSYSNAIISVGVIDSMKGYETFQEIASYKPSLLVKTDTLTAKSNYGWDKVVLPLNNINLTGKQIAFMMKGCGTAYMYLDNVAIEAAEGFTTPIITDLAVEDTAAVLTWAGGASDLYNVYVIDTTKSVKHLDYFPYLQDADAAIVTKYANVQGTNFKVTGLEEKSTYEFYVELASKAGQAGALSNRRISTTTCSAIDGNGYSYGFEPGPGTKMGKNPKESTPDGFTFQWPTSTTAGDTVYKTPDCWTVGLEGYDITSSTYKYYIPSMRSNAMTASASSRYIYALSGYSCMQFDAYSSTYANAAYAVMPLMKLDMDTAEISFYGRCLYVSNSTGKFYSTSYIKGGSSTAYSQKLAVGTVSDPSDISSFVALDTVEYEYTTDNLSTAMIAKEDPNGTSYFQHFVVPLKDAKGKFIAFRQIGYGYFYMDDLSIRKRQTARAPRELATEEVGSTTATIAWKGMEAGGTYAVQYKEATMATAINWDDAKTIDNIATTSYTLTGLKVNGTYVWRVCQKGTEFGQSEYAVPSFFQTECLSINPNGYSTGFECNDNDPSSVFYTSGSTTYRQNECWTYLNHGTYTTKNSSWPYNIPNTATSGYGHSGVYGLKLYAYSTTYQGVAVTPAINAEIGQTGVGFDTLQVSFWACPSYHGISGTYKDVIASASGTTYAKTVEVGTCTDPDDPSTYTVLKVCTYQVEGNNLKQKSQANAANDYAFQKFTVKLNKATGPYVFFRASKTMADGTTKTYSTMYIDDVTFETLTNCEPATSVAVSEVTIDNAKVSWNGNGGNNYDVWVAEDATFIDTVCYLTAVTDTFTTIKNLSANQPFYVRVKSYCDEGREDGSDWSQVTTFYTPKTPMFEEQFTSDNIKTEAKGWTTSFAWAKDVFGGTVQLRDTTLSGYYNSWYRVQNVAMSGYAMRSYLYYTYSTYEYYYGRNWLVSPQITLDTLKNNNPVSLSFTAALTYYSNADPITTDPACYTGWDDQFMVIVSDDGGATWKKENAIIWNNETGLDSTKTIYGKGDYVLTDISNEPQSINIDLSQYAGKTIKIAFYAENSVMNAKNAIHIDDIHVNYTVKKEDAMTLCQYEDIDNVNGFSVDGDTVSAGLCYKERYNLATEEGEVDSIFILSANYMEAPVYNYEITVCEGTPFSYLGFNEHTAPGTYRKKLTSYVTGCDSIVNFTIKHTKGFVIEVDTAIAYGNWFTWHGIQINDAGQYTAYLQACEKFGGCDSTVTMNVTISSFKRSKFVASICEGDSYEFGGKVYTQAGTYYDTIPDPEGIELDSVATLVLKVNKATYGEQNMAICHGSYYEFGGQKLTEAGDYVDTIANVAGCDSILTLHLTINEPLTGTKNAKIVKGCTYTFQGVTYTKAGTYVVDTLKNTQGCDSILTLVLTEAAQSRDTVEGIVCPGEYYIDEDFNTNVPGWHETTVSAGDCDLIRVLHLQNYDNNFKQEVTITKGETYTWRGKEYTEAGTYTETVPGDPTAAMPCDSVMTLKLTVNEPQGITNVGAHELSIRPNVVSRHETAIIHLDFTEAERQAMRVAIYDMVGHRMTVEVPETGDIQLNNFPAAGIYTVRIMVADETYVGRIVVKE